MYTLESEKHSIAMLNHEISLHFFCSRRAPASTGETALNLLTSSALADAESAAYWAYHVGRTGFFLTTVRGWCSDVLATCYCMPCRKGWQTADTTCTF
jgi:hypothetical protein